MKLLFVCLGNICRSPTAEGVVRKLLDDAGISDVEVDSCGTGGWHTGDPPDARTVMHAKKRGYDLSVLRARQLASVDFMVFDAIYAMDQNNLRTLASMCPPSQRHKPALFLWDRDVPDPYYGGPEGFEHVLDLVEEAGRALVASITAARRNVPAAHR